MSLFQCDECGCCENTASARGYHLRKHKGDPSLCSECLHGKWHGKFKKTLLPKGMFITNREGNLEHKETGSTDIEKYEIKQQKE